MSARESERLLEIGQVEKMRRQPNDHAVGEQVQSKTLGDGLGVGGSRNVLCLLWWFRGGKCRLGAGAGEKCNVVYLVPNLATLIFFFVLGATKKVVACRRLRLSLRVGLIDYLCRVD